jgi:hypothetical protein
MEKILKIERDRNGYTLRFMEGNNSVLTRFSDESLSHPIFSDNNAIESKINIFYENPDNNNKNYNLVLLTDDELSKLEKEAKK